jgi:hypothetical protein
MDAPPAVNRPPLRNPSPILGSGSLSLLPVRDCAPVSPKDGCLVRLQAEAPAFPAMSAPARPGDRHRHIVLIVTTRIWRLDIRLSVGHSGRMAPPTAHNDA